MVAATPDNLAHKETEIIYKNNQKVTSIPFNRGHCELALILKDAGLKWRPTVGHYIWDPEKKILKKSPFNNRIYYVLNIEHFIKIFSSIDTVKKLFIWLPTYYHSRLICEELGIEKSLIFEKILSANVKSTADELSVLYNLIITKLNSV
ncbi:MAG TPA: hypothetical protein VLB82_11690 [Thermodesulfobacteriota bacterium]|nr:hypothetical protein [Thermodesulfobacteriota bacterium]